MKNLDLFYEIDLPTGFSYPSQFKRVVGLGMIDIEPWYVLEGMVLRSAKEGLSIRYPLRNFIPFARRQDNDDIACWEANSGEKVFVVHDFASPGWEVREEFSGFYQWLRKAIDDLIEFDC